ncbi:hypothetical protein [Aeromonas veronii]|uniref:hypothetical protein n=1 Tax=Aeromonas veronii TaxID=654 RepID=UPI0024419A62|nr:hypothetical protein [Aeromonas veronii]
MTEHTKGLLALFRNGQSVGSTDGYGVCELWPRSDEGFPNCEGKENGRRIVACWNLLHGYPTKELEGVTLAEFVAKRAEQANKREQELAEQLADATRQCGVMAELLREVTKIVPAIGVAIDDLPVVDAFLERVERVLAGKLPDRQDTEWTDATTSPVAADYRELQGQHDQLQSRLKGALDTLKLALPYVEDAIECAPSQQISEGHKIFAAHIKAALTGDCEELFAMMQEQNPADALVLMSDIASLQRYTLGGHCDSFGQDCGAEMEQDDEGEYILLAEALTLPAAAIPSGGEPCATEPPSSSPA